MDEMNQEERIRIFQTESSTENLRVLLYLMVKKQETTVIHNGQVSQKSTHITLADFYFSPMGLSQGK